MPLVNTDFLKRVVEDTNKMEWQPSPQSGVYRKYLDRLGEEKARATTIVKFDPKKIFPYHVHEGGEEFLILKGDFNDAGGDFSEGEYCRHPIGSSHQPWSNEGGELFVKLRQMTNLKEVKKTVHIYPTKENETKWKQNSNIESGSHKIMELFKDENEEVTVEELGKETSLLVTISEGGEEIYVLKGSYNEENDQNEKKTFSKGFWIRTGKNFAGKQFKIYSKDGCLFWKKSGHLKNF